MSDGSVEAELFATPVHYRDKGGHWEDVDTRIGASDKPGFGFGNAKGRFKSDFGRRSDQLVEFELGGRSIALGAAGVGRAITPVVDGSQITYPDVFGDADVRYRVGTKALKEEIVLDKAPQSASYTFDLTTGGLEPWQHDDGSIGFYREGDSSGRPALVMPKPYMLDSADDPASPYGKRWSGAVTQKVTKKDDRYQLTLTADSSWLSAPERKFPLVIDPTIEVVPEPAAAQDTMIFEGAPTSTYGAWSTMNVGNAAAGANSYRGLLKFDVAQLGIAPNTPIKAASLDLHFTQPHTNESGDVALEARKVTADWTESTANWAGMNTAYFTGSLPYNYLQIDDEAEGRVLSTGPWQYVDGATNSINGGLHQLPTGSTADTFTWNPDIAGSGTYRVDAYYTAASNRGVPSYAVTDDTGTAKTYTVNQTSGTAGSGVWATLGYQHFSPGKSASVTMSRVTANSSPVADALRFVQAGTQTKLARERDTWHSYAVGNIVQEWVNNPGSNFGLMVKASNEVAGSGGPRYEASEDAYGGETANRPRLLIQYDTPSVDLTSPTTLRPTGAELSWGDYIDPSPADGDDLVDFAIYRGCVSLPGGACTSPAPEYFNASNPSGVEQIGIVPKDVQSFVDTSATASTPTETASFRYWVVARTKDGTLSPSTSQFVQTPRPGRVARVLTGDISDSTIANATAYQSTNIPAADGYNWLMAGNNHPSYGDSRALLAFDTGAIPTGATVLDSELQLWLSTAPGAGASFDIHELTRDFAESQVTWNNATSTIPWTTKGGDYIPTVVATKTTTGQPGRLAWKSAELTDTVQRWANKFGDNHGLLIKAKDEAVAQQRLGVAAGEVSEPALRPKLRVEYIEKTTVGTYYAPEIPDRVKPNTTLTVPVTVTNTTKTTWSGQRLSYRWMAGGSDAADEGDRLYTAIRDLEPGDSETVNAQIRVPINSQSGNKRQIYDLELELRNATGVWGSDPASGIGIAPLRRPTIVEDPTSSELGLEKFFTFAGEDTGAGSTLTPNLHAGNAVFSYSPIQNPSRGASAFVRLTYDSNDITSSAAGRGWSVQASTLTRLGRSSLSFSTDQTGAYPRDVTMIDGDGTAHSYTFNSSDPDPTKWYYERPSGVALDLRLNTAPGTPADKAWSLTRPDGTRFYFEDTGKAGGIQRYIVDRNGNTTEFRYDVQAGDTRLLTSIVDPDGRTTLALTYVSGTARLQRLADISGRTLRFVYDPADAEKLTELRDGGGYNPATDSYTGLVKSFKFAYGGDLRLSSVKDPLNGETKLTYWATPWAGRLKTLTDRRGKVTEFSYVDIGGTADPAFETTVTGILVDNAGTHRLDTIYTMDPYGRATRVKDANGETTKLAWDQDNNVARMEEANGAVSTWTYDAVTGYPTTIRDAEANRNGTPATELKYTKLTSAPGTPTVLTEKKSPEGRRWQFTYDPVNGNLETVTDPLGVNSATVGDYQTGYDYNGFGQLTQVHDANGNPATVYADYDFNGYPKTITDPLGKSTQFQYDLRGQVVLVKDALLNNSTAEYDDFGRVTKQSTPLDGKASPAVIQTTQTQYDLNDNVTLVTAPNGAETRATYNAADEQETSVLPSNGASGERKVTYTYDDLGRLLQKTAPQGNLTTADPNDFVTRYTYDPIGQLLHTVTPFDGKSSYKTSYVYDRVGNLERVIDPRKNDTADAQDFTSRMTYDLNHRVVATTDAAGYTSRTVFDRDGLAVSEFDADGNKKATVYDARGKVAQVSVPHTPTGRATVQRTTKYSYDENGNQTAVESPLGVSTTSDLNDSIERMTYDANNKVVERVAPYKPGDPTYPSPARTYFEYDAVGNLARQSDPTYASTKASARDWSSFTWFDNGLPRASTDPWGISTSYGYNLLGQQTSRTLTSAAGGATRAMAWEFWPDGSLKTRNDTAPPAGLDEVLVDNSDSQNTVVTGTWATASSAATKVGYDYRTHVGATGSTDTFAWKLRVPSAGTYEVFVRCPQGAGTATAAVYSVQHSAGTASKTVNQSTCTAQSQWVSLGAYSYAEGVDKKVTLAVPASGTVVADAVKLVRAGSTPGAAKDFTYGYDVNGQLTSIADRTPNALVDTYEMRYDGLGRADQVRELKAGSPRSTTTYGFDANSNMTSWFADDQVAPETDQFSAYTYDVRDLLESVKTGKSPTDTDLKATTYTYTARGERAGITKPNGNKVSYRWIEDGLLRSQVEMQGSNTISSHSLGYDLDGRRTSDVSKVQNADSPSAYLNQTANMVYTADGRLRLITKTGANPGDREAYSYDAAGNMTWHQLGTPHTFMKYDRNRLLCAGTIQADPCSGTPAVYNYDPFGRLDTVTAGDKTVERYGYDGFDRTVSHRKYDPATGTAKSSQTSVFDPLDRTLSDTTTVGTGTPKKTTYGYVGLTDQVINEEQPDSGGTPKAVASYTYGPSGERISQTKTPLAGGAAETSYYGLNPHTDVETLTSETGAARSTYRYTGYGSNDATGFTGKDKASATGGPEVEPYNPYRFNSKRWDPATAGYDMGFRDYSPGLNRFLTRDMYAGALADLKLGTDPWNTNRYAFAGGNPITGIELDGHYAILENGERVSSETPTITSPESEPESESADPATTEVSTPSRGQKFSQWMFSGKPMNQKIGEEVFVKPVTETIEACKAAIHYRPGSNWTQCQTGIALTAWGFTGVGKVAGVGVKLTSRVGAAATVKRGSAIVDAGKFDYMFGRVASNSHNAARSKQNAAQLARIGVHDTPSGRSLLGSHFDEVVENDGNIALTFSNNYGTFQVRESLLSGPGGFLKLESTWQVTDDGLRMTTMIPMGGR